MRHSSLSQQRAYTHTYILRVFHDLQLLSQICYSSIKLHWQCAEGCYTATTVQRKQHRPVRTNTEWFQRDWDDWMPAWTGPRRSSHSSLSLHSIPTHPHVIDAANSLPETNFTLTAVNMHMHGKPLSFATVLFFSSFGWCPRRSRNRTRPNFVTC